MRGSLAVYIALVFTGFGCDGEPCLTSADCQGCAACIEGGCVPRPAETCTTEPGHILELPNPLEVPWLPRLVIDGDSDEWQGLTRTEMTRFSDSAGWPLAQPPAPDDLSARFVAGWTDEGLALLCEVRDSVLYPADPYEPPWTNDAVDVALDLTPWPETWLWDPATLFQVAEQGSSPTIRVATTPWGTPTPGGKAVTRQTEDGYVLEMLVEWGSLAPPPPGTSMLFDVVVHDDDDAGAVVENQVSWADETIKGWLFPTRLAPIRLMPPPER